MSHLVHLAVSDLDSGRTGSRRVKTALAEAGINLSRRQIGLVPVGILLDALTGAQQQKKAAA